MTPSEPLRRLRTQGQVPPRAATNAAFVTFAAPGVYTLTVQVRDDDGGSATDGQSKLVVDDCDCTKSQGFWKHQLSLRGKHQFDDPTLRLYLSIVRFASGLFGPGDPTALDTLDQARASLDPQQPPNNNSGPRPSGRLPARAAGGRLRIWVSGTPPER